MTNSSNTLPSEEAFAPYIQPYVRLTQRNTHLFMQFAASPEMVSLWLKNSQNIFNHAVQNATDSKTGHKSEKIAAQAHSNLSEVGKSKAFAGFMQELMVSQMQFLVDLAQTNMATLREGPAKLMEQLQQAAGDTMPLPLAHDKPSRSSKRQEQ
jgi:hypothetical protein